MQEVQEVQEVQEGAGGAGPRGSEEARRAEREKKGGREGASLGPAVFCLLWGLLSSRLPLLYLTDGVGPGASGDTQDPTARTS